MDHHQLLRFLAAGRVAVGATLLIAPKRAGVSWGGPGAAVPGVSVLTRALGVRDAVLGVGTLRALDAGTPVRDWALLGAVCDAVDFAATTLATPQIGLRRSLPVMLVAGTATAIGISAARHID